MRNKRNSSSAEMATLQEIIRYFHDHGRVEIKDPQGNTMEAMKDGDRIYYGSMTVGKGGGFGMEITYEYLIDEVEKRLGRAPQSIV